MKDLRLATQQDVKSLREEIKDLGLSLRHDISLLDQKIIQSEQRMTIKLGTIVSIAMGVAVTLMKMVG